MSQEQRTDRVPYRVKIETGGKRQYAITEGPPEMSFVVDSTIFQKHYSCVEFTVETLGRIRCRTTGYNKYDPDNGYSFFGRVDGMADIIIIGYYTPKPQRSGWMRFYTRRELKASNPELYNFLTAG